MKTDDDDDEDDGTRAGGTSRHRTSAPSRSRQFAVGFARECESWRTTTTDDDADKSRRRGRRGRRRLRLDFFVLDMRARNHAQRQHIVHSVRLSTTAPGYADRRSLQLDMLLYQLHTVSFFLAPSLWSYVCRLACQSQLSKSKELESPRSLRFLFGLVIVGNVTSVSSHSTAAVAPSSVVVLDLVGFGTSSFTCAHHHRDHLLRVSTFSSSSSR